MQTRFAVEPEVAIARPMDNGPHDGWILYAEDNEAVRELCAASLNQAGYNVVTVADGGKAWEELQRNHFDLLITDNEMPCMTGLELIARVRRDKIALEVILASGSVGPLGGPALEQLRLNARLQKPFSQAEFLDAVKAALSNSNENEASFISKDRLFLMQNI